MRAIDIKGGTGPAESLYIKDNVPVPEPKNAEILVKVKAFGLNRMDLLQREGKYPLPPQAPTTLGVEFSGTVVKLGGKVTSNIQHNDEVMGLAYGGAYAEYISVSEKMLIRKPREISWEQAAGFSEVWITAMQALYTVGDFRPGDRVLVHAGASSVGIAAVQLLRSHGAAAVYVTTSSADKIGLCKVIGATEGFNYKTQNFDEEILKLTEGKGVDLVIDSVGQSHWNRNINVLAKDGRMVMLGSLSGTTVKETNIGPIIFKRLRIQGSTLRSRDLDYQVKLRDKVVEEVLPSIMDGSLKIFIEKVLTWKNIVEAHKLMESNQARGKIICLVD